MTPGRLPNNTLKVGTTGEMAVKVERQYDYAGEFTGEVRSAEGREGA